MKAAARPFIALIAALLLVFAQQAAFAHMIGHAGASSVSAIHQDEEDHGAALTLSHTCTTCLAFTALAAFVAAGTPFFNGTEATQVLASHTPAPLPALPAPTPRARAPPIPL